MTSEQNGVDGGPAFPRPRSEGEYSVHDAQEGMTLRDYFAAKELGSLTDKTVCAVASDYARYADHCYRMADAMLAARGAKP